MISIFLIFNLCIAAIGIASIVSGSRIYTGVNPSNTSLENEDILKKASSLLLIGNIFLFFTAYLGGDIRYISLEVIIALLSLKSWLHTYKYLPLFWEKIFSYLIGCVLMIVLGVLIFFSYITTIYEFLTPLGFSCLALAMSIIPNSRAKEKKFRSLFFIGGCILVVSTVFDFYLADTSIGKMMSFSFFLLNVIFTAFELRNILKK